MAEEFEPTLVKVPPAGGKSFSQIERDTNKVIEKNRRRFANYLADDIRAIEKMLAVYLDAPTKENMRPIFNRIHNLRGQGTLFDYPLVTVIGGHFCRYIDNLPEDEPPRREVVITFINSLKVVQSEKIQGEGTGNLKELTEAMGLMVDSLIKE